MGLVGPGFVGVHHIAAAYRPGQVDVVAICASGAEDGASQEVFAVRQGLVARSTIPHQ
jgi:hypothetical protein